MQPKRSTHFFDVAEAQRFFGTLAVRHVAMPLGRQSEEVRIVWKLSIGTVPR